jgi:drug/metabolite transporter (DMT)-like permease
LGALVLSVSALLPIALALYLQRASFALTQSQLLRLILAGCMMGVGTTAFNFVVNSRKLDASISVPVVDTGLIVISVIGAVLFFAEPLSARKLVGIALMVVGILVLKPG